MSAATNIVLAFVLGAALSFIVTLIFFGDHNYVPRSDRNHDGGDN